MSEWQRKHRGEPKYSCRMYISSVDLARVASGLTKESVSEYVSRVVAEQARADLQRLYPEFETTFQIDDGNKKEEPS